MPRVAVIVLLALVLLGSCNQCSGGDQYATVQLRDGTSVSAKMLYLDYWGCTADVFGGGDPPGSTRREDFVSPMFLHGGPEPPVIRMVTVGAAMAIFVVIVSRMRGRFR